LCIITMCTGKGVDLTGLLGRRKRRLGDRSLPAGYRGRAPVGVCGTGTAALWDEVPQKLKLFCETTHNICIKIQQTTAVAVTG